MTKEQALKIVEQAEAEHEPCVYGLSKMVAGITGWDYYESDYNEGKYYWQQFHDGMGTTIGATSEEVAEMLAWKVDRVENLLFMVGRT